MKYSIIRVFTAALIICLCLGVAGSAADGQSLVSRSYLEGTFQSGLNAQLQQRLEGSGQTVLEGALDQVRITQAAGEAAALAHYTATTQTYMKEQDVLIGPTGFVCTPLSGSLTLTYSSGAVVDATEGREVPSGTNLTPFHRYIVAEDTLAYFAAASQTAVVEYEGYYARSNSGATVDYPAIAQALQVLNLFQGSDTPYGSGFDLEADPTRLQALVMFIRVLGEEQEALACTAPNPFRDIVWGDRYVAYAYEKGYTNGYGDGTFGSNDPVDAVTYVEFLLRAMGYSTAGVDDWTTALTRAVQHGVITAGEQVQLTQMPFHRAQVAYLSYYALSAPVDGNTSLASRLMNAGVFSSAQWKKAQTFVTSSRLA